MQCQSYIHTDSESFIRHFFIIFFIFGGTGSISCVVSHSSKSFKGLLCVFQPQTFCQLLFRIKRFEEIGGLLFNVWFQYKQQRIKLDHCHPKIHLAGFGLIPLLLYQQVKISLLLSWYKDWMNLVFSFSFFQK